MEVACILYKCYKYIYCSSKRRLMHLATYLHSCHIWNGFYTTLEASPWNKASVHVRMWNALQSDTIWLLTCPGPSSRECCTSLLFSEQSIWSLSRYLESHNIIGACPWVDTSCGLIIWNIYLLKDLPSPSSSNPNWCISKIWSTNHI